MSKPVPFAHLLGFGKKARAEDSQDDTETKRAQWEKLAEEDPEREQKDDESDEDYESRMKAMDEEEQDEQARRAESDLDGADETDPDEAQDDSKEAKKAARAARASERARCAAIVAAGIKANQLHTACSLAFDTRMSAAEATRVLAMSQHDKSGSSLANRMAGVNIPNPSTAAGSSGGDPLTNKMVGFAKAYSNR